MGRAASETDTKRIMLLRTVKWQAWLKLAGALRDASSPSLDLGLPRRWSATIPAPVKASMRAEGVDFVGDAVGVDAILDALGSGEGVIVQGRRVPSVLRRLVRTEVLSTETHPYLLDHAIDGTPVFPLACAANNIAFTSCIPAPFELSKLTLYQGITVTKPVSVTTIVDNGRAEIRAGENATLAYKANIKARGRELRGSWCCRYAEPQNSISRRSTETSPFTAHSYKASPLFKVRRRTLSAACSDVASHPTG